MSLLMTVTDQVVSVCHRSRWGFHACDKATDRKLRFLNAAYLGALRKAGAWTRWHRKAPANRVSRPRLRDAAGRVVGYHYGPGIPLAEPKVCELFTVVVTTPYPSWYPVGTLPKVAAVTTDPGIRKAAKLARTPCATPADVKPLPLSAGEIDRLYRAAGGK